jgi:hypothetical protein
VSNLDEGDAVQRFDALASEHLWAAKTSRRLTDEAFIGLEAAADELVGQDDLDLERIITRPMSECIITMVTSASGGHRDFAVPGAAGFLLDAIYTYTLLQHKARLRTTVEAPGESRRVFRDRMDDR